MFFAANGADGRELYATSTSDDARLVADIKSGAGSSAPDQLTDYQGILYFAADDGVAGRELWKSDATTTVLVKDINPGIAGSFPTELVQSGSHLLFSADDGVQGAELWQSDAAENTTSAVRDVYPGVIGSVPRELTDVDGQLFFTAFDPDSGDELWTSFMGKDAFGMPRRFTQLVKDIYPDSRGTLPFSSSPGELTNVDGSLFFAAGDATTGRELWVSYLDDCQFPDPVRVTTRVRDIHPGVAGSDPTSLTAVGDAVYFVANDGTKELWISSFAGPPPTCPGLVTSQVKDLNAGDNAGSNPSNLTGIATSNGVEVYFTADDGVRGRELWKTSRSTVGTLSTVLVSDINSGPNGSFPSHLTYAKDASTGQRTLFFSAFAPAVSNALWKLDNQGNPVPLAPNLNPQYLTEFNGTLFFAASAGNQTGLWKSDGTTEGTQLVKTFSAAPFELTVAGGALYFSADDGVNGWEAWKSDGTTEGTQLLADLYTGPFGAFPRGFTAAGQHVFFAADDGSNGDELYRYHPTFGLSRIDINPGPASSLPDELTHVSGGLYAPSGVLYFSADDGVHGREVHSIDLSGGANPDGLLKDVKPGTASSFPTELTNVAGTLYFSADDGEHGQELWGTHWEVDPVTSVPFLVAEMVDDIHSGPRWSLPRNLTNVGGQLYFSANNGNDSDELWVSNGTPTGTVMLADINPGGGGSWLSNPLSVGNVLFVTADDGTNGTELWVATSDPLPGDVNLDGRVGFDDFLILSGNYGETNATRAQGDLDGDGTVGFSDFLQLSANFGTSQQSQAPAPITSSSPQVASSSLSSLYGPSTTETQSADRLFQEFDEHASQELTVDAVLL